MYNLSRYLSPNSQCRLSMACLHQLCMFASSRVVRLWGGIMLVVFGSTFGVCDSGQTGMKCDESAQEQPWNQVYLRG